MNVYALECPKCHGQLEVEEGLDTFYCKFCGKKIILDDLSKEHYHIKALETQLTHEERMKSMDHALEDRKMKAKSEEDKRSTWIIILCFVLLALSLAHNSLPHTIEMWKLQRIEKQVVQAIEKEDYESALLYAKLLVFEDSENWSRDYKQWKEKKQTYIKMIEEQMHGAESHNADYIYMPTTSSAIKGKNAEEIADLLRSHGFTNVSVHESIEKANLFHGANTIEHVVVSGKTDFSEKDLFHKDSVIAIYYYH